MSVQVAVASDWAGTNGAARHAVVRSLQVPVRRVGGREWAAGPWLRDARDPRGDEIFQRMAIASARQRCQMLRQVTGPRLDWARKMHRYEKLSNSWAGYGPVWPLQSSAHARHCCIQPSLVVASRLHHSHYASLTQRSHTNSATAIWRRSWMLQH